MEKLNTKLSAVIVLLVLLVVGSIYLQVLPKEEPMGSLEQGNAYDYTQYTGVVATSTQVFAGQGTLGSVIITEDAAGTVVLYDATSTAAIGTGLETIIADFEAAAAEGVYTFDVGITYGLVFVTSTGYNFAGDWTITWRYGL